MADDSKLRGEQVELLFAWAATNAGMHVSKPLGESQKYDFITDDHGRLCRVQVKSGAYFDRASNRFMVACASGGKNRRGKYGPQDCDFVAVYLVPVDTWYILPIEQVIKTSTISIRPHTTRHDPYKEAWHLLRYA